MYGLSIGGAILFLILACCAFFYFRSSKRKSEVDTSTLSFAVPPGTANPMQSDNSAETLEEGGTKNVLHEGGPRTSKSGRTRTSQGRRSSAHRDSIPEDQGMAPRRSSAVIRDSIPEEEAARRGKVTTSGRNRGSFYEKSVKDGGAEDEAL